MRIYHLGDLHFGKSIYGLSMLEDQRYWCEQFLEQCRSVRPDLVLIAGDVYDRSAPNGDAVELLDWFLTSLAESGIPVALIAGNHDSGQRLSFGRSILAKQNIHISGSIHRELDHVTLKDEYGPVTVWLVPYTYPEQVSAVLQEELHSYDQAMRRLIEVQQIDPSVRNIIVSHQNVTANGHEAERGGSESMVGGVGQIDYHVYDPFEYAALGHIHAAYPVGRKEVRYAGTPLCYHMGETRQKDKGYTEVILKAKGEPVEIRQAAIRPLHNMRYCTGTKEEIDAILKNEIGRGEYIGITVTDQRITPELAGYYRQLIQAKDGILMELLSAWSAHVTSGGVPEKEAAEQKPIEDLFADLYTEQNGGTPPTDGEYELMRYIGELVRNQDTHLPMDMTQAERVLKQAEKYGGQA